jgi:alpha-tubulin suppressor-like RCC1 family protein
VGLHFCARSTAGRLSCWGDNGVHTAYTPTEVDGLDGVVQVVSGAAFDCARRGDGTVWCRGVNDYGQLGRGDFDPHDDVGPVAGLSDVTAIGAGAFHACARAAEGVFCWGWNVTGQIGSGALDGDHAHPTLVAPAPGMDDVVQLVGSHDATCARTSAGRVFCWGRADMGEMGDGQTSGTPCGEGFTCRPTPSQAAVDDVVDVTMGSDYALVRLADGSLEAWGMESGANELGNGLQPPGVHALPVNVAPSQ